MYISNNSIVYFDWETLERCIKYHFTRRHNWIIPYHKLSNTDKTFCTASRKPPTHSLCLRLNSVLKFHLRKILF